MAPHEFIKPGNFSIREWVHSGKGNLWITWREDQCDLLKPLISCWVDIACNELLSLSPDRDRRFMLMIDELGALNSINSLEHLLTRGRKNGICTVACLQSLAQLEHIYGPDKATILLSCFRNLVALGLAKADSKTAEMVSKSLGEREVCRVQDSSSIGANGISHGETAQVLKELLVLPGELTSLPNLNGYLALAEDEPVRRFIVNRKDYPQIAEAILEEQ